MWIIQANDAQEIAPRMYAQPLPITARQANTKAAATMMISPRVRRGVMSWPSLRRLAMGSKTDRFVSSRYRFGRGRLSLLEA
jgi:hypothetical protein